MRRAFVLALLVAGMRLVQPLGSPGYGSQALLAFGFLILGAYAVGEIAVGFGIPKLVGHLLGGVVFGPFGLNIVAADSVAALAPVGSLAIALIAFLAGAELRWPELRERGGAIVRILAAELGLTLVAIVTLVVALRDYVPFLAGGTTTEVIAFGALFASIAVVHSPAVAMALLNETRARGPVARTSLGVVLLSDVVIVLLLTVTLIFVRVVVPPTGANVPTLALSGVAWEIGGAAVVGGVIGALVALYLRVLRRELFLFAIIVAFFGSEIARLVHVEPLLTLIVAGFVAENVSLPANGAALRNAMERAAAPVFVVFFALAGAQIELPVLAHVWLLVLPLVFVRGASVWAGCRVGAWWAGLRGDDGEAVRRHLWTGLIPQAGVAIGLAATVADTYPERGGQIRTIFLALVAVNQAFGPILFRRALARSGEIPPVGPEVEPVESTA